MQITFYGTGSCRPSPKVSKKPFRSYTGFYVEIGHNSLLFDIGPGVLHKMLLDGIDIKEKPTHLFISHLHQDHTADIVSLMQTRRVAARDLGGIKPLVVGGPKGLQQFCDELFNGGVSAWKDTKENGMAIDLMQIHEIGDEGLIEGNGFKVKSSLIDHFQDSICLKLESADKSIVYSGDMVLDDRICKLGFGADLAILECSFPTQRGKHLGPEEVGKLAKLGEFKKIVLTHMFPECEGREDEMIATIKNIADVEVIVGYDLLKLDI